MHEAAGKSDVLAGETFDVALLLDVVTMIPAERGDVAPQTG